MGGYSVYFLKQPIAILQKPEVSSLCIYIMQYTHRARSQKADTLHFISVTFMILAGQHWLSVQTLMNYKL